MSIYENIILAINGIKASKMRSLLTMLGIIIGIASVIAIVTVGNSLTKSVNDAMEELGANRIFGFVTGKEPNSQNKMYESDRITDEMMDNFKEKFADRVLAINVNDGGFTGQAKDGRRYSNVNVYGADAGFIKGNNLKIIKGSDLRDRDIQRAGNVIVVSDKLVKSMFPPNTDPLGKEVKIYTQAYGALTYTIIGVYEFKLPAIASNFVSEEDMSSDAIIPITTMKRLTDADEGYAQFSVSFDPNTNSNKLEKDIKKFFDDYYKNNQYFKVDTQNMKSMMDQFTTMISTIATAIAIIAMISLLVGGIGVMNIMLVSVTERTREIGTRKALGAQNSAIRAQFVIESMILCLIGGTIGVILGMLLGYAGSSLLGFPATPPVGWIIAAFVSSMLIGVFFGFYPANKAAQLDPIEALRYE